MNGISKYTHLMGRELRRHNAVLTLLILIPAIGGMSPSDSFEHFGDFALLKPHHVGFVSIDTPDTLPQPRISDFDHLVRKHSDLHDVDWLLVSSIIWTESKFRSDAVSPAGAMGLMQLMPRVAGEPVEAAFEPEENIRMGIRHFLFGLERIRGRTEDDVLKLALAAYNAGLGHLRDAQNLTMQRGGDSRKWKDVRESLLLLQDPEYYLDARYGYCRGSETVEYVDRVIRQYSRYRNLSTDQASASLDQDPRA